MKKAFYLLLFTCFVLSLDAQKLKIQNQPYSNLEGSTLVGVGDFINGKYATRKTTLDSLSKVFNIFRTETGNVASIIDSSVIIKGLRLKNDTTLISNTTILAENLSMANNKNILIGTFPDSSASFSINGVVISTENEIIEKYIYRVNNFNPDRIIGSNSYYMQNKNNGSNKGISTTVVFETTNNKASVIFSEYEDGADNFDAIMGRSLFEISEDFISAEKIINANAGIKIIELSYKPVNSTDLQNEAIVAEIGTSWLLDLSGSWYLVTKITSTKLARAPFAEW